QQAREALATLAAAAERSIDLDAVEQLARSAPAHHGAPRTPEPPRGPVAGARIAVASGRAFSFHYRENLELLEAAGAELQPLHPVRREELRADGGALILAGGFPEVFVTDLEANDRLRSEITAFVRSGRPVMAEC